MRFIDKYKSFLEKKLNAKIISGIAVVYDNKVLLVHDANKGKNTGYGIPKGGRDGRESVKKTAVRELEEETGIRIKKSKLGNQYNININKGKYIKIINYYVYKINSLDEIGLDNLEISKDKLQVDEIDDAKFMDYKSAKKVMNRDQISILNNLLKMKLLKK